MRSWKDYSNDIDMGEIIEETPRMAVMGCFQNGKSTLVNCLLDGFWALPGDGKATTSIATRYRYKDEAEFYYRHCSGNLEKTTIKRLFHPKTIANLSQKSAFQAEVFIKNSFLDCVELVDTPGFNAKDTDSMIAKNSLEEIDYVVFVTTNKSLTKGEKVVLGLLKTNKIPFIVIVNCISSGNRLKSFPNYKINKEIAENISLDLIECGFNPESINGLPVHLCNLLWYWRTRNKFDDSKNFIPDSEYIDDDIDYVLNRIKLSDKNIVNISSVLTIKKFLKNRLDNFNALHERIN